MAKRNKPAIPEPGRRMEEQPMAKADTRNRMIDGFFSATLPDILERLHNLESGVDEQATVTIDENTGKAKVSRKKAKK